MPIIYILAAAILAIPGTTFAQQTPEKPPSPPEAPAEAAQPDAPKAPEEPAPKPKAQPRVEAAETPKPQKERRTRKSRVQRTQHPVPPPAVAESAVSSADYRTFFDGYIRTEYFSFTPKRFFGIKMPTDTDARRNPLVGRNDGFALGDARLNFRALVGDRFLARISIDGVVANYERATSPIGTLDTAVKDAYMQYRLKRADEWDGSSWSIFAGRFKPPYDMEELRPTRDQYFVRRALESRGILRHEGFAGDAPGFAPGRQIGVMSAYERKMGDNALRATLAITNGNAGDATLNDNDQLAYYGRMSFRMGEQSNISDQEGPATYTPDGIEFGLSLFYNEAAFGDPPNIFDDRIFGAGVDVSAERGMFVLQMQALAVRTDHLLRNGAQEEYSLGGHAQLSVKIPNTYFAPGYRFAYYDPRTVFDDSLDGTSADIDRVMHHTVGVRWAPDRYPLVLVADFTLSMEQEGRQVPNDRFELAAQLDF